MRGSGSGYANVKYIKSSSKNRAHVLGRPAMLSRIYRSRAASLTPRSSGLSRNSSSRRLPVFTSTVTLMPGDSAMRLSATWTNARRMLARTA